MNTWFTVKVKYTKQLENGMFKRITEPYLLAAMTFTDAETRIYEELDAIIRGEFNVVSIARTELHDIFMYDDTATWWKCKITYEASDLHSEKTKKITQTFLVSADTAKEAYERIRESLSTLLVDFSVLSIIYSPIVEIFPYRENLDKEIDRKPIEALNEPTNHLPQDVHTQEENTEEEEEEDAEKTEDKDKQETFSSNPSDEELREIEDTWEDIDDDFEDENQDEDEYDYQ